ncbi:MAG: hypothetical protein K9M75_06820 [Phycisphaerae bacterium]|nr:hypothetical protein [Phycisphaerae bacterium]
MDRTNILEQQWDYLIILDACRFDYFEKNYADYFDGELTKVKSIGSCTDEWRDRTFTSRYDDIVYISSNPHISSDQTVTGFLGGDHFHEVHDIWNKGWDYTRGTVLPETVTAAAKQIVPSLKGKRVIIHYLQPHAPYLTLPEDTKGFEDPNESMQKFLEGIDNDNRVGKRRKIIMRKILPLFRNNLILGNQPHWIIKQLLFLPPNTPMDAVRRKYGVKGLRKAYEMNLRTVLEQVRLLLPHLPGKVVVTADHGELLGEKMCFTHKGNSDDPLLVDVPWFVPNPVSGQTETQVEKEHIPEDNNTDNNTPDEKSEDSALAEKLRALGYMD